MPFAHNGDVEIYYETPGGALSTSACFQLTEELSTSPDGLPSAPKCPSPSGR